MPTGAVYPKDQDSTIRQEHAKPPMSWKDTAVNKVTDYLQKKFNESMGQGKPGTAAEARRKQGPGMWQADIGND
jgi:hypothetical protein